MVNARENGLLHLLIRKLYMSTPAHLWLEDENGSPIVGGCLMPQRAGSIELKSFSHGITIPVDPHWGKLTGTRVHRPVVP
jgi:type VI secretion system secreted protein Hcp